MGSSLRSDDTCPAYVGLKDGPILYCEKAPWHKDHQHACQLATDNDGTVLVTWEMELQNAYLPLRAASANASLA